MSVSILVVDDEPDVAELFRQRFRRETHQDTYVLHYATSGAEVLDRLAGEIEPTRVAVLSDINTPCMDGLQLLVEIKQRFPDLPVMMVTAYGDDERRRQSMAQQGLVKFTFREPGTVVSWAQIVRACKRQIRPHFPLRLFNLTTPSGRL